MLVLVAVFFSLSPVPQKPPVINNLVTTLVKIAKSTNSPLGVVPFIGLTLDVLVRLKNMDPIKNEIVNDLRVRDYLPLAHLP